MLNEIKGRPVYQKHTNAFLQKTSNYRSTATALATAMYGLMVWPSNEPNHRFHVRQQQEPKEKRSFSLNQPLSPYW